MKNEGEEQKEVTDSFVFSKAFAPKENRVNGTNAVNNYGEQKEGSVS
jgi:hypothetical protein